MAEINKSSELKAILKLQKIAQIKKRQSKKVIKKRFTNLNKCHYGITKNKILNKSYR